MSNSAYTVFSDDVDIYQVSGRRLAALEDHRKLFQSIKIGYSVTIASSLQVNNIIINIITSIIIITTIQYTSRLPIVL